MPDCPNHIHLGAYKCTTTGKILPEKVKFFLLMLTGGDMIGPGGSTI